jgi:rhomboid family protein
MFVPLHDSNPLQHVRFQYVTFALIVTNVVVFLLTIATASESAGNAIAYGYGVTPAVLFDLRDLPLQFQALPDQLTLVSYMFLHGGWMHLIGNMAFLWVFGDNVEDAMGHFKFLFFYLACGIFAGLLHSWMNPASEMPLVGASGAVAGVIAAYLMLHPRVKVWVLVLMRIPLRLSAFWLLGFWVALQVFNLAIAAPDDNVAWWAHIGGLIAGAVLVIFLRRDGVPLFDQNLDHGSGRGRSV